jgi:hypothetical protein
VGLGGTAPPVDTRAVRLRYLILWLLPFTVLFVVAEYFLVRGMTAPIDPACWDQCGMGQQMSTYFAAVVALLWLVIVIAFVWAWRRLSK